MVSAKSLKSLSRIAGFGSSFMSVFIAPVLPMIYSNSETDYTTLFENARKNVIYLPSRDKFIPLNSRGPTSCFFISPS